MPCPPTVSVTIAIDEVALRSRPVRLRRRVVAVALAVGAVTILATTRTNAQTPPLPATSGSAVPAAAPPLVAPPALVPSTGPSAAPRAGENPPPASTGPTAPVSSPVLVAPGGGIGDAAQSTPVETPARRWYGWQTLTLDALWMVGIVASLKDRNGAGLFIVSGADYLLGAPIVHWAHGHGVKGAGSLFMRITPVVVGVAIAAGGSGQGDEGLSNLFTGLAVMYVGGIAAAAIDAAVLAREDVPTPPPPPVTVAPRLSFTKGGGTLGLGGAF